MPKPLFPRLASVLIAVASAASAQDPAAVGHPDTLLSRISFGSCAFEARPQPIWNRIVEEEPQLWIWAGDAIYIDLDGQGEPKYVDEAATEAGFRARTERKFARLFEKPGYQELLTRDPFVLATWDDHDYGLNDAGFEFRFKSASQDLFLDAFGVAEDSPRRQRDGIYHCETFGPVGRRVQVILLDTRSHRTPLQEFRTKGRGYPGYRPVEDRNATMLGNEQWSWLEERLREPADLRLIVSSIQFVSEEHRFEKWANIPNERDRMLRLIEETGATGVVFLSGDRHQGELSRLHRDDAYPLYDLTASGLTQSNRRAEFRLPERNQHRVGSVANGEHFGDLDIDWSLADPILRMRVVYSWGEVSVEETVRLSELWREPQPVRADAAAAEAPAGDRGENSLVESVRRIDGSYDDWSDDSPVAVDGSHVYVRFSLPEPVTLLSADRTIRVAIDLDGSDGTGQTFEGLAGSDVVFEFNPDVTGRDSRRYRYLPRVFTLPAGAERGEIDVGTTGLQFQPTFASRHFEMRVGLDIPRVATEIRMSEAFRSEAVVTVQSKGGGPTTRLCGGAAVVGRDRIRMPSREIPPIRRDDESIRVMSWNVLWGSPQDPDKRERFSRVFRALDPDIVLIQEWDRTRYSEEELTTWFTENVDAEANWSAMVTGLQGFGQGTAVVTRHPILVRAPAYLPVESGRFDFPMRLAAAVVETPRGRVLAGSVHLKASGALGTAEDQRRLAEARAGNYLMRGLAAGTRPDLIVLGGDLNMNGTTEVARLLFRDLDLDGSPLEIAEPAQLGDPGLVHTFGNGPSKARFDYLGFSDTNAEVTGTFVFETGLLRSEACARHGVEPTDVYGSDHLPVVLDLRPRTTLER